MKFLRIAFAPEDGSGGGASGASGGTAAAAAAAPAASAAAPAGAPGSAPPSFADSLPADIRAEAVFRDIKDLDGLAKSYYNASKMLGNRDPNGLFTVPPPEDAEGWDKLYNRLGRPEAADKYTRPEVQLPEGMTLNEGFIGEFAAEAHKRGITDSQFQGLVSWYLGKNVADAGTQADAKAAVAAQTETVLKKDWGAAYDQNLGLAKSALAEYFGDAMVEHLEKTGLGNHPDMLKGFAKLGQQLAEDGKLTGKANGSAAIAAPTEAQQQINGMMKDQAFLRAWKDKGDPGHQAALDKMQALYAQAYPGEG